MRSFSPLALAVLASACQVLSPSTPSPKSTAGADEGPPPAVPAEAAAFVKRYNDEGARLALEGAKAAWVQQTHITEDTQFLAGKAQERWLTWRGGMIEESKRFTGLSLAGDEARAIALIKTSVTMPAPRDPAKVAKLADISTKLESMYGTGKYCKGKDCRDLEALMKVMAKSRNYDELLDAWTGWRSVGPAMKPLYQEFASLMNEGAGELGFADTGALWRGGYDMSSDEFEAEVERLWQQVKPLYEQLHCYVRAKLGEKYGKDKVPDNGPIPAHLLGNMWGQEWNNIYDVVQPYPFGTSKVDIDGALETQGYTALQMVKSAESFYTSLGLVPLPKSFYERSLFVKPPDREVVCHASAWDIDSPNEDLRIKMCIDPSEEDLVTIYHELGHIYYYEYYRNLPFIFQSGAHDGFHEAIGDALTLSMTPAFYEKIGLAKAQQDGEQTLINQQMKLALEKIAFLPFGKLIDQWRWQVFSGKVKPSQYNAAWWKLREQYQGIAAPVKRTEEHFDPGAKYHIPANTPYTRYFLARILQFQFHRALCQAAGQKGPLHACSIHGSAQAGSKLSAMLSMGQREPWPNALEKLTGARTMDASAIIDYFAPLMTWLEKENKSRTCGW
jgi:peptidyl-dipeptidase A